MQKTPNYPILDAPIEIPAGIPAVAGEIFVQRDHEITWLHRHDYPELGLCRDGAGVFAVGNKLLPFRGGDVVYIAAGEAHLARSTPGGRSHWIWCYADFAAILPDPALLAPLGGERFLNVISSPGLYRRLETLIAAARLPAAPVNLLKARARALDFAAELLAAADLSGPAGNSDPLAMERVRRAINHLGNHYREKIALPALARRCGMSTSHFRRIFRAATGRTPQEYLNNLRLGMAQAALAGSDRPIAAIALDSGFPTLSSFNRQFLKTAGVTPGVWRRRERSGR